MTVTVLDVGRLKDLDEVRGEISFDWSVGQIGQITFPALDRDRDLVAVLAEGQRLAYAGESLQIVAQDRAYGADGLTLGITAQSQLAAALKADRGPRGAKGVTPGEWMARRAKVAGGRAVVQPGAKRRHIVQKRGQSALAVIESLAGDMATTWTEHSNTIFVGTPWWALQGGPDLPLYAVPLTRDVALDFAARSSGADDANAATASLLVPHEVGIVLRPWCRLEVSRAAKPDNGVWLVESVKATRSRSPVEVELTRPRRSSIVRKGSSSTAGEGASPDLPGEYAVPEDGWVPGADKQWRMCNKTPREIVALALKEAANGVNWGTGNCLNWVSHVCTGSPPYFGADGGHGGLRARYVWDKMPAGTPHGPERNAPAGSLVVWRHNLTGHVAISVGGGYMVTTNTGPVQRMPIGAYMGWGGYAGWMAPNFWT